MKSKNIKRILDCPSRLDLIEAGHGRGDFAMTIWVLSRFFRGYFRGILPVLLVFAFVFTLGLFLPLHSVLASTVLSSYKYAWSSNSGYINFENVAIGDRIISGYAWSANHGWINLNPTKGGVLNDGKGILSGYAWGENLGWINFSGVRIDVATGRFSGTATGTLVGTLTFDCPDHCDVRTDWRPDKCHNGLDDDSDGLTDYPADLGCLSVDDNDETNLNGGLPVGSFSAPSTPSFGFSFMVNDGAGYANNRLVKLKLNGGPDTKKMSISNTADFNNAILEDYNIEKIWDVCASDLTCADGDRTVYVRFYTATGQSSSAISNSIFLDRTSPVLTITEKKNSYDTAEEVILKGQTESGAEVILSWAEKYGVSYADDLGNVYINLGKMMAGSYRLNLSVKDLAGNNGESLLVDFMVVGPVIEGGQGEPEIGFLPGIIDFILPDFLKPNKPAEPPAETVIINKETPLAMRGDWELLTREPIARFVLSPLPIEILRLAEKFPTLNETLVKIGIEKITDLQKLKVVKLSLSNLAQMAGLVNFGGESGEFLALPTVPINNFSPEAKRNLPTEIVFARTAGESVDLNVSLSVNDQGETTQKIFTVSGELIQLAVKPDKPVQSVSGYLVFNSRQSASNSLRIQLEEFVASLLSTSSALAQDRNSDVLLEQRLVLFKFDYFDADGDGIYTAEVKMPKAYGEYEIITVLDFQDASLTRKAFKLITVVDPEGYVYRKNGSMETRISGATVSIFWLNPENKKYELWPAKEYKQENQQLTDISGSYSYLVPAGMYYLTASASGYENYQGKPFEVADGGAIHSNIEMKPVFWHFNNFNWQVISLVIVVLILVLRIIIRG